MNDSNAEAEKTKKMEPGVGTQPEPVAPMARTFSILKPILKLNGVCKIIILFRYINLFKK